MPGTALVVAGWAGALPGIGQVAVDLPAGRFSDGVRPASAQIAVFGLLVLPALRAVRRRVTAITRADELVPSAPI